MNQVVIETAPGPAPAPKVRVKRLTAELKALKVGETFLADPATAHAYIAFARHHKLTAVQEKQPDGQVRVWRTA